MQPESDHNDPKTWKPEHDLGCYCDRCIEFATAEVEAVELHCDNCGQAHAEADAVCGNYCDRG